MSGPECVHRWVVQSESCHCSLVAEGHRHATCHDCTAIRTFPVTPDIIGPPRGNGAREKAPVPDLGTALKSETPIPPIGMTGEPLVAELPPDVGDSIGEPISENPDIPPTDQRMLEEIAANTGDTIADLATAYKITHAPTSTGWTPEKRKAQGERTRAAIARRKAQPPAPTDGVESAISVIRQQIVSTALALNERIGVRQKQIDELKALSGEDESLWDSLLIAAMALDVPVSELPYDDYRVMMDDHHVMMEDAIGDEL